MVGATRVTPAGADPADFTEYPVPTPDSGPTDIVAGPDGALWFIESAANKIGRSTTDGIVTEFAIPTEASGPTAIAVGPDGALWFTESAANKIGRIATDGAVTEFPVPTEASAPLDIVAGPDGNLWFTENAALQIGRLAPGTGVITEFGVEGGSNGPAGITTGPDGNLWITDFSPNNFGGASVKRITTAGIVDTFPLELSQANPTDIAAGPDGNLWVAESGIAHLARVTPAGEVTHFGIPGGTNPRAVTVGADGNLWFSAPDANRVGRMTVAGQAAEFALATPGAAPTGIAAGPDGRVWFTEPGVNQVANVVTTATPLPAVYGLTPPSGPSTGGTAVTISGIGFTGATAVQFGESGAQGFSVVDDATITATAPALPGGRHDVTVTTPEGTSGLAEADLYASLAPLAVTGVAPDEADPVGGIQVTVSGSGFTTASSVRFGDAEAPFNTDSDTQITVTSVPPHEGDGVVDVVVTAEHGTSAPSAASRFTYLARPVITGIVPRYGPAAGGTIVVVNGSRLTGARSVAFGDAIVPCPARCTSVSDNQLAVLSPPHAPAGVDVVVTSASAPSIGDTRFAFHGVGAFRPSGGCDQTGGCMSRAAALLADGRVLEVGGGFGPVAAQLYDPRTETWTPTSQCLGCPFQGGSLTVLPSGPASACGDNCGKVLLTSNGLTTLYDPATNAWEPSVEPNLFRVGARAVLLRSGKVLVVGGVAGPAEVFDPATETWSLTGTRAEEETRLGIALTLLADGRVLATGGFRGGPNGARLTAQIFDPAAVDPGSGQAGSWTLVEPMHTARYLHTATLLPGGKVLVAAGQLRPTGAIEAHYTDAAEVFDPATGHWSDVAPLTFRRGNHATVLLPNGKALA
ncbi:MAG: virginiamycin B lyase family protein, partial [Acidimicrobiales bacterium]